MMKYMLYIITLVALFAASACTFYDKEELGISSNDTKTKLQVVGKITQFSDCEVATRSKKDGDEPKVTSMGLALFPIEDGEIGNCIYYDYKEGGSIVFIVDRSDAVFNNYTDKQFAMYIFANMQGCDDFPITKQNGIGKSLEYFTTCEIESSMNIEDIPVNGFPMMGSLGDVISTDGDGVQLIIKPTPSPNNIDGLPIVGGNPTDNLEISLKAMYAKFSFTISVVPEQEIVGNRAPRFDVTGYTVYNIAKTVDCNSETNDDSDVLNCSNTTNPVIYAQGATDATFDFYLPGRYLTPSTKADEFSYPLGINGTSVEGYNNLREEDKKYAQRYKPLLPGNNQKATYLTIEGKYLDHQGNTYDVSYDIYLGGDNYGNFDIIRNTHYINSIIIRGLSSSNDHSNTNSAVSFDHRVTVERSIPLIINFRRETLLDSHFEVRPLRVRPVLSEDETVPSGASVTVSVLNADGTNNNIPNWVRLEASGTSDDHIISGVSAGKRKYFTTDLVKSTLANNKSVTQELLNSGNTTFWVYVDENVEITNNKSSDRSAIIRVSYTYDDKTESQDYKIVQQGLFAVATTREASIDGVGGNFTYFIENHEEYLYNYDSENYYGHTDQSGMKWGLDGVSLSSNHKAFVISHITGDGSNIWDNLGDFKTRQEQAFATLSPQPLYDFYLYRDIKSIMGTYYDENLLENDIYADKLKIQYFNGHTLNQNIASYIKNQYGTHQSEDENDSDDYKAKIDKITLDQNPKSAFAYCYNRNKRNPDGTIDKDNIVWYLPAVDEIEDIVEYAHADFEEFQNNMYWSCQPAYIYTSVELQRYRYMILWWEAVNGNIYYGSYFSDDNTRARATKAVRENGIFKEAPSSGSEQANKRTGIIYISATNNKATEWNDPTTINTNPYHEGNLSRKNTKARVRCVYKKTN